MAKSSNKWKPHFNKNVSELSGPSFQTHIKPLKDITIIC